MLIFPSRQIVQPLRGIVGVTGLASFIYRDAESGEVTRVRQYRNKVTNVRLNLLRDAELGDVTNLMISHMAGGTGVTAPAATDTQLGAEQFRKAVTLRTADATGIVITTTYIDSNEGNFTWREVGGFVGGTAAANSGSLWFRIVINEPKDDRETLQLDYQSTYTESP